MCEHDWPCRDARLALLISFQGDRVGLMMYLAAHLANALEALPDRHPSMIVGQILCRTATAAGTTTNFLGRQA
ncbi:hypothetical protein [Plantactinospora sp. WMMB782]|uniref:hypothetical protein n=1 Tax=Plantactinospora sp. WMMB782 TaxID=3404121 RepID=UPI003B95A78F